MRFKIGDRVKIKSLDWYNKHTNGTEVDCGEYPFTSDMKEFCGQERIIANVCQECYFLLGIDDKFAWTDEMIEGLVEEETKKEDIAWMYDGKLVAERFSDGAVIKQPKYNKLSINTELCDDKVELTISPDFELKQEDDKWFVVKKKKEYPKTYEECCKVMNYCCNPVSTKTTHKEELIRRFQFLLLYRDAYWKIAGEEMGLNKAWEPDYDSGVNKYGIICMNGVVQKSNPTTNWERHLNKVLDFPTEEMRDAFYEYFKELIEQCKELL